MSRRRRVDENEDEDEESGSSRDRLGEAIGEGLLFTIGVWIIIISNWNYLLIGIGALFAGSPILQIPAIRIAINNKTGHQIFKVSDSHIQDSTLIQSARDVHIYRGQEAPEPKQEQHWDVDEEFTLKPEEDEDWRDFEFDLEDGEELVGSVETDGGDVNCYVLGRASFRSFQDDEGFNPYWAKKAVTKTMVSFPAPGSRKYFFVVVSDEEDEDVSVTVRLSVKG